MLPDCVLVVGDWIRSRKLMFKPYVTLTRKTTKLLKHEVTQTDTTRNATIPWTITMVSSIMSQIENKQEW